MRVFACLIVALLPLTAAAQSSCGGQTQLDANFCAKEKWEIADRELNRIWKEVKPRADARGDGQTLLNEQRAWLKTRDATCEPELKSDGSAAPMFYWACMEEQTLTRNQVLEAWR
ncbi:lysozyme inhibitor LprI family protein [Ruegeria arenilitoris]|uniref:lysozyme inhibitor LprI family protein n=1 Tax=Ruegeria arenilitoris TaxID=1173585 RepID=UPI0014815CCD|nr:lysozyme inhibitor LprI family protein [Ruegeria arenilitoris]